MPALHFIPRGLASECVRLGSLRFGPIVGEITAFPGRLHRATWRINLPGIERNFGPCGSFEIARKKFAYEVERWLERCGVDPYRVDAIVADELKGRDRP